MPKYLFISLLPLHKLMATIKGLWAKLRGWGFSYADRFVKVPGTERELEAWFDRAFHCEEGPPAAGYNRNEWGELLWTGGGNNPNIYELHTFSCLSELGAEARLCQAIYDVFEPFAYQGLKLVWRRLPRTEHEVVRHYGPELGAIEAEQDGLWKPGPTDVLHEFAGTYHAGAQDINTARIRLRLFIEGLQPEVTHSLPSYTDYIKPAPFLA